MIDERRRGLGRGLSALLGEAAPAEAAAAGPGVRMMPIERLHPGRFQPRRRFDEESLTSLAESIAAQGVLQPLLVRDSATMLDGFEILAGERRWRAAQRAGLHEVPVVVRAIADREALEIALVENIQREDLQPLEEARGYQRLIEEFAYTQEQLAQRVGKSRSHVANMMRLLGLPEGVRSLLEDGRLTMGHARALLGATDPEALAHEVVRRDMSVRETERAAQRPRAPNAAAGRPPRDPDVTALETALAAALGLKVSFHPGAGETGTIQIHYRTLDQLDMVLTKLRPPPR
ncbi:MAG TPA: ParB/RepB/Spo0J family partition protein [Stellaceae bacterium]|nr:ParB/RepB/Spo0J family partition protein [Stellaceae bacterium]